MSENFFKKAGLNPDELERKALRREVGELQGQLGALENIENKLTQEEREKLGGLVQALAIELEKAVLKYESPDTRA